MYLTKRVRKILLTLLRSGHPMTLLEFIVELEVDLFDGYGDIKTKLQTSYGRTLNRLFSEGLVERRWKSKALRRRSLMGGTFERRTVEYQYRLTLKGRKKALKIKRGIQEYIEEWGRFTGARSDEPQSYHSQES